MARKKYIPNKLDLRRAWAVKRNGGKRKDICEKLEITNRQYQLNISIFKEHFAQELRAQKRKTSTAHISEKVFKDKSPCFRNGETKLNVEDLDFDVLKSYIICGFNRDKIANLLGVSRRTLFEFIKNTPEVENIFNTGKEEIIADIMQNSFLRLCRPHSVKKTYHTSYLGDIYSKDYIEHKLPNLHAVNRFLANTIGWGSEPKEKQDDSKGTILSALDKLMGEDGDD